MAHARHFKDTVKARVERDPAFRDALLAEAVERLLSGELEVGKALLHDFIGATIGFEQLALETGTPSRSLISMLSPNVDPTASELFGVIDKVRKACRLHLHVAMGA